MVLIPIIPRAGAQEESEAMSWGDVKAAGKKAFDKWSEFTHAVTPIIVDGVSIAKAIHGKREFQ